MKRLPKRKIMAEPKDTKSKAQRALEFKQKYETLLEEAKQEQLDIVNGALSELREMGAEYTLLPGRGPFVTAATAPKSAPKTAKAAGATTKSTAGYDEGKSCQICGTTGHDGRAHRNQEPKKAFTAEELTTRGLAPTGTATLS